MRGELAGNIVQPGQPTELTLSPNELDKIVWDHEAKEPDYSERLTQQTVDRAKAQRDGVRAEVANKLKEALPGQVIPRYLRRAVWSQNAFKIYKAVARAEADGWTREEMKKQVRLIQEERVQNKKYEVQDSS